MPDGLDKQAQLKVLQKLGGDDYPLDELTRNSIVAPYILKFHDVDLGDKNAVGRGVDLSFIAFLGNLVFLQDLYVPTFGSNWPLWSLANEFWYYLWFPALFMIVKRRRQGLMAVSRLAVVLMPGLLPGFLVWLIGTLVYFADKHLLTKSSRSPLRSAAVNWISRRFPSPMAARAPMVIMRRSRTSRPSRVHTVPKRWSTVKSM